MRSVVLAGALGLAFALGSVLAPTFAHAEVPLGCEKKSDPPLVDFSQSPNLDTLKHQLLYYRCTRYDIDVALALRDARQWVERRAPEVAKSGGKPAIVLDIDETSLSNWRRIYRDDFGYVPDGACDLKDDRKACGDGAWAQTAMAPAIEPTLALYRLARCEGIERPNECTPVEVFFVTGRKEVEREKLDETGNPPTEKNEKEKASAWTLRNLHRVGYDSADAAHLYMREEQSSGPVSEHKIAARKKIEERGYTIIANVGDQESDLVGGHAARTFKVPNPFYFIP
jgi:HAD superfamily, subfamily IIIB (Acid phosphatase)